MNTISRHTATYVDMDVRLVPQGGGDGRPTHIFAM